MRSCSSSRRRVASGLKVVGLLQNHKAMTLAKVDNGCNGSRDHKMPVATNEMPNIFPIRRRFLCSARVRGWWWLIEVSPSCESDRCSCSGTLWLCLSERNSLWVIVTVVSTVVPCEFEKKRFVLIVHAKIMFFAWIEPIWTFLPSWVDRKNQ